MREWSKTRLSVEIFTGDCLRPLWHAGHNSTGYTMCALLPHWLGPANRRHVTLFSSSLLFIFVSSIEFVSNCIYCWQVKRLFKEKYVHNMLLIVLLRCVLYRRISVNPRPTPPHTRKLTHPQNKIGRQKDCQSLWSECVFHDSPERRRRCASKARNLPNFAEVKGNLSNSLPTNQGIWVLKIYYLPLEACVCWYPYPLSSSRLWLRCCGRCLLWSGNFWFQGLFEMF